MVGKKLSFLISFLLMSNLLVGCSSSSTNVSKIGIIQTIEHPALDASREGFIKALEDKGYKDGENIEIDAQNAQGDMPTNQTIAKKFVDDKKDLIFAISTQSAQASYNATKEIPIVITAVTDPVDAGIAKSFEKPGTNVTGTSDAAPIDKQFQLIKDIFPDAKKIGILYNTSESNSQIQVDNAKKISSDYGFEIIPQGITNVNDIPQTVESMLSKIDVLYAPTDNTVASSIPIVVQKCYSKNIPVIGAESGQVKNGALATVGVDYYKLGYEAGLKAVEILEGKSPQDIPITLQQDTNVMINEDAVKKLNITIPDDILKNAEKVSGGVK